MDQEEDAKTNSFSAPVVLSKDGDSQSEVRALEERPQEYLLDVPSIKMHLAMVE